MKKFKLSPVFVFCSVGLLCVLGISFGAVLVRSWREYNNFKTREIASRQQLIRASQKAEIKEEYLNRLLDTKDPEFLERVARQKLGYSRPDEIIFRFEK